MLLYINEAMSFGLVGQVYNGTKVLGSLEMPEAYLVTFQLAALQEDAISKFWYSSMPQPPLSLPLGYSVNRVYFANAVNGQGTDCYAIKAKNNTSLLNQNCYIQMPSTRAVSLTDQINLPDDATKMIFDMVVARLKERLQLPQDIVQDDLPAGNKSS